MSTTWSIEHIPANGGASTFASLAVWGLAGLRMQFVNWGVDQAAITTRGGSIAFEAAQFAYLDKLVVWRNGARFAHFWITGLGLSAEQSESRTYTLSGPSWWLGQYAPGDTSNVTLYTAGDYIELGMGAAIDAGAPVGCDSGVSAALNIGCPDVRSAGTVLALVQEAARHVPFSSGWWDCSGETPILHASRRSALSTVTLALGTAAVETFGLTPIPELQLKSVCIRFGWTGGASYYYNTAGTGSDLSGPNRLQCSLNYGTQAAALEAAGCGVAERVFADMSALPWSGAVNLHATEETDIDPIRPGRKVNLAGGLAEWATMDALVQSVVWSVSPETNDICTLNLGAPDQLGIQEYFDLRAAVASSAAGESDAEPVSSSDPAPGTYDDLNGGTGGGSPVGGITVQARGGSWTLCGLPEYVVSTPPQLYHVKTFAGTILKKWAGGCNYKCAEVYGAGYVTVSGAVTHDAATCAITSAGSVADLDCDGVVTNGSITELPDMGSYAPVTATATTLTRTGIGCSSGYVCSQMCDGARTYVGSIVATLSSPDTEEMAMQRVFAVGAEWADGSTAIRTIRVTGITGMYCEARYRTEHTETASASTTYPTLTGLSPWGRYQITVTLESRPVDEAGAPTGDGSWSSAATRRHYFVADLSGEGGIDWQVVKPTAGYETRIASTLVEVA